MQNCWLRKRGMPVVAVLAVLALHLPALIAQPGTVSTTVIFTNRFATFTNLQGETFNNVRLLRADAKGILYDYADKGGGGRISFTNLSPFVLKSLGLSEDSGERSIRLTQEEIAKAKKLADGEKERMRNPANWRKVHVTRLSNMSGDTWMAGLGEMSGDYLIHYMPPAVVDYFRDANAQIYELNQKKNQLAGVQNQLQQNAVQIANLKQVAAQIREDRRRGEAAQANEIAYGAGSVNYAWNVEMDRREDQNQQAMDQANEQKQQLQNQQSTLQGDVTSGEFRARALLDKRTGPTCEIRIFTSRQQYGGSPILFGAPPKDALAADR